eukprot:11574249-Karenia_brevis.AAC.1
MPHAKCSPKQSRCVRVSMCDSNTNKPADEQEALYPESTALLLRMSQTMTSRCAAHASTIGSHESGQVLTIRCCQVVGCLNRRIVFGTKLYETSCV